MTSSRLHPVAFGLLIIGCVIGGILACWGLAIAIVVLFFNQSEEAWNGGIWILTAFTVFALPLGVLFAIGSCFEALMRSSKEISKESRISR